MRTEISIVVRIVLLLCVLIGQAAAGSPAGDLAPEQGAQQAGEQPVLHAERDGSGNGDQKTVWAWVWDYLVNGASVTAGVGSRQADLQVTRKTDEASGKISQRDEEAYFLSYSTRPTFLGRSQFAYTFMLNYVGFNMEQQETSKNLYEDLGTRVRGRFLYLVPTLFYQWGEHRRIGKFVRLGIGLGVGTAKFNGDIILTDSAVPTERVRVASNDGTIRGAVSAFLEARYRHWGLKLDVAGPGFEDDLYKYSLSDMAVSLGYSYYF